MLFKPENDGVSCFADKTKPQGRSVIYTVTLCLFNLLLEGFAKRFRCGVSLCRPAVFADRNKPAVNVFLTYLLRMPPSKGQRASAKGAAAAEFVP